MNTEQFNELKSDLTSIQTAIGNLNSGSTPPNQDLEITQPINISLNETTSDKHDDLYTVTGSIMNLRSTDIVKYALKHDFMITPEVTFHLLELQSDGSFIKSGDVIQELSGNLPNDGEEEAFFEFVVKVWDHSGNALVERSTSIKNPSWFGGQS